MWWTRSIISSNHTSRRRGSHGKQLHRPETAVGDVDQVTPTPRERGTIASHGGCIVQLIARIPRFGEGQQVPDPERAVPELLRQRLKEEENLAVFLELAEFRELELAGFSAGV